jgi:hypothetical protein
MMTKRFEIHSDLALVKRSVGARMLHYNLVGTISRKVRNNRNNFLTEIIATGTKTQLHEFEKGLPSLLQQIGVRNSPVIRVTRVDNVDYDDVGILKTGNLKYYFIIYSALF